MRVEQHIEEIRPTSTTTDIVMHKLILTAIGSLAEIQWLENKLKLVNVDQPVIVNFAGRDRKLLTHFLDTIRNYERESHNLIGFDERETSEFIDIYFENDYSKISE